jgi:hypothetical protein
MNLFLLRAVLFAGGVFVVFSGLKTVFGALAPFVADPAALPRGLLVHENHLRFLGGIWIGLGLLLLVAPFRLRELQPMLYLAFALIFAGGVARLTILRADVLLDPIVLGSLAAELVAMPVLFYWLRSALGERR